MAHDAIVSLKDRTGSSLPAISKYIMANNEHVKNATSNMFKSRLSSALKAGVKEGRFAKVKNSFKINPEWTKKQKAAMKAKEAAKKRAGKQRQKELDQKKEELAKQKAEEEMSPEQRKKKKYDEERKKFIQR